MKRISGWWRLWIAGSALWVAFWILITARSIPTSHPRLDEEDLKGLKPELKRLVATKDHPLYGPDWLRKDKGNLIYLHAPDEQVVLLGPETTTEQMDAVKADYIRLQSEKFTMERRNRFRDIAALTILPCLVVLILGLSCQWVIRGFKKKPV